MNHEEAEALGRLLIVDDEPTFLLSTAELLRRNGYLVHSAKDGFEALVRLETNTYDALISDIIMPGNEDLEFVRKATQLDPFLLVILVTAYPALPTAIGAIQLPVEAYMVKPVNFQELLETVHRVVKNSQIRRVLGASQERLELWNRRLQGVRAKASSGVRDGNQNAALDFLRLAVGNLAGTLMDMETLLDLIDVPAEGGQPCTIQNCPRMTNCRQVIGECVDVLEKTKTAFKSRALANVRSQLEGLLRE